ncbi:hypothetical protein BaRGS_00021544 [Batillaria attramentaria]|uniref:Major facilitator superfamily (MFS) profile domain-containing protein n=1 Tax=Batillaria attramentaria TaxID=370345 RepID=A0ABD0KJL8_9CAEN
MAGKDNRAYEADEKTSIELQKPDSGVLDEAGKTHPAGQKELHPTVSTTTPDSGEFGWVIVAASLYLYTFTESAYGYGVFFVPFEDYFGSSNAETAWLVSAQIGTMCIVGPLASMCVNRLGCRVSAMFGSVFAAVSTFCSTFSPNIAVLILFQVLRFGQGFVNVPANVSVGRYIARRRGLAAGIVTSGGGIAAFVFPPFFNFLLMQYGWKGALWIYSGLVLNGLVCSFVYPSLTKAATTNKPDERTDKQDGRTDTHDERTDTQDGRTDKQDDRTDKHDEQTDRAAGVENAELNETGVTKRPDSTNKKHESFCDSLRKYFDLSVLKSPAFLVYWFSVALTSAGLLIPSTFLPPLANDLDIDSTRAAFLVSIMGIASTASRIASGFLADLSCCDPLIMNGAALVIGGLATSLVPFLETYPLLAAYSAVYGCCLGGFVSLRTPILIELLGLAKFIDSFGILFVAHAIGCYAGSPLAGFISDLTSDYSLAFQVTGAIIGLSGVICVPLCCHIRRSPTRTIDEIEIE